MLSVNSKYKISKRNSNPFCSEKKKKQNPKNKQETFSEAKKRKRAESDRGSWFKQEQQWPQHFQKATEPETPGTCSSKRKLKRAEEVLKLDKMPIRAMIFGQRVFQL